MLNPHPRLQKSTITFCQKFETGNFRTRTRLRIVMASSSWLCYKLLQQALWNNWTWVQPWSKINFQIHLFLLASVIFKALHSYQMQLSGISFFPFILPTFFLVLSIFTFFSILFFRPFSWSKVPATQPHFPSPVQYDVLYWIIFFFTKRKDVQKWTAVSSLERHWEFGHLGTDVLMPCLPNPI